MRGTPQNTFATFPTRKFTFIFDPLYLPTPDHVSSKSVFDLIHDLRFVEPRVDIHLLLPTYLATPEVLLQADKIGFELHKIPEPVPSPDIELDNSIQKDIEERFRKKRDDIQQELALLALSESLQADGIITLSDILIDRRYTIYQHHHIRIIPSDEFPDTVEVIAHGNSIFWSTTYPERRLNFDIFYQLAHWKNARLFKWHEAVKKKISNRDLADNLRSALLNRYPYILYSRDMIRFYELQREYYSRRGLLQRFDMMLGYYVNTFYLMLWGMLDQLTVIAKYARNLDVNERNCGIRTKKFWEEFGAQEPELTAFIKSSKIDEWIDVMADMRHHAAHKVIKIPTPLVADTEESEKTDEQILEIVKQEKAAFFKFMPEALINESVPVMISEWRLRHMKMIAPSIILIKKENGRGYFWDPVISMDHDLAMLTAVMDAFIVRLFRNV